MKNPLVSIIVPTYNSEKYIKGCIDSIVTQTYRNIELILIDDCSEDNTVNICNSYVKKYQNVKLYTSIKNTGVSDKRNTGISHSKGEYIYFVDSDDTIEPNAIDILINNSNEYDLVICNFNRRNDTNRTSDEILLPNVTMSRFDINEYIIKYLHTPNNYQLISHCWNRLFKSSIIKMNDIRFDVNMCTFEDVKFNLNYITYINELKYINIKTYNHFIHNDCTSQNMRLTNSLNELFGFTYLLDSFISVLDVHMEPDKIRRLFNNMCVFLSIIYIIRICAQLNRSNRYKVKKFIYELVNDNKFKNQLLDYKRPTNGSKIIPFLIKHRLLNILILICKYKARKRYGR